MAEPFPKCCVRCGRWGNRQFRETTMESGEGWECSNIEACSKRMLANPNGGGAAWF